MIANIINIFYASKKSAKINTFAWFWLTFYIWHSYSNYQFKPESKLLIRFSKSGFLNKFRFSKSVSYLCIENPCVTSTLLSSARHPFPSGFSPAVKGCFGLHGHYAFGSDANKKSGVGGKSATSVGLTTDLVHWLQAGKIVAVVILRIHRGCYENTKERSLYTVLVLLRILETLDYSRLRRNFVSVICEGQCTAFVVEHSLRPTASVQCKGDKAVSFGGKAATRASFPPCWC